MTSTEVYPSVVPTEFVIPPCQSSNETWPEAPAYFAFSKILQGYMSVGCVLLGTIGNLYGVRSVHIANFDKNRGVVLAVSVLALAFWDTVLLWSAFFYYVIKKVDPVPSQSHRLNLITPCFHGFSQIANTASIWCVVAITAQRYMATRDPFRCSRSAALLHSFRERRTSISFFACYANRRLLRMPFLISIFAILVNIPAFFEIAVIYCNNTVNGGQEVEYHLTKNLRGNEKYVFLYRVCFRLLIVNVGPNSLIILMTLMTIIILKGSNRSRRQLFRMSDSLLDRYSSREMMQTTISIMLVTKFLIFRSLSFMLDIFEASVDAITTSKPYYWQMMYVSDISNFFILLNSATNCLIFLKASSWLNDKISERKTMKRKKTLTDSSQISPDRIQILSSTWEAAKKLTNGQIGFNVLYAMVRRQPSLLEPMRPPSFAPGGETHIVTLIGLPCKRSFDFMAHAKYQEIAGRITSFIEEILEAMKNGAPEQCLILRIRRVGAIHHSRHIKLSSSVWKEFKASLLQIIAECDFPTQMERETALEVWATFISFIIREMKMGVWAIGESIGG